MATMGFTRSSCETQKTASSILVPSTFTHSIAFGQTGSGKTTSFIYPNLQERMKLGHGILLYDYKGREHYGVKHLANEVGRLEDVIEIAKPWGESINLVQNMDEEELDIFFSNVLSHSDDNKYWENSAKSLGQSVLRVLSAIEAFADVMLEVDPLAFDTSIKAKGYDYPLKRNFTTLVNTCRSFENLSKFIKNLDALTLSAQDKILSHIKKNMESHTDDELYKSTYVKLIKAHERLKEVIKETDDSLANFGEESNENLTQNIMGSLTAPLLSLSQNAYFNAGSFDIATALNEGKIIVINAESLSNSSLEALNNVTLYELSKRTRKIDANPISIFIDEAQRVLSENTDLPIDVLREAKVDIFLATQNSALLKDRLSAEKFEALMGNLTRKYYFKNSSQEELESESSLSNLETFEYVSHEDDYIEVCESIPIYVSQEKKIAVERTYQKNAKVLEEFAYLNRKKSIILEYSPRLYKDKKLIAIEIKTMKETVIESQSSLDARNLDAKLDELLRKAADELNRDNKHEFEYEFDVA